MANVKTQGTQLFTVIDGQVVRFVCTKRLDLVKTHLGKLMLLA